MKCSACGHDNPDAASFCGSCGAKFLPTAAPPTAPAIPYPVSVFPAQVDRAKPQPWIPIVALIVLLAAGAVGFLWWHGRVTAAATLEPHAGSAFPSQVQKGQNCSFDLTYKSVPRDVPETAKMVVETPSGTVSIPGQVKTENTPAGDTKISWIFMPLSVAAYRYHFEATSRAGEAIRYPRNPTEDLQLLSSEPTGQQTAEAKTAQTVDELRQRLAKLETKTSERAATRQPPPAITAPTEIAVNVSSGRLTDANLAGKSAWELTLMRNTIYARHGYRFHRTDLSSYFSRQSWYQPDTNDQNVVQGRMSAIERYNTDLISSYQKAHGMVGSISLEPVPSSRSSHSLFFPAGLTFVKEPYTTAAGSRRPVICIDPGHPSDASSGTHGRKITEIRADWLVALRLKSLLTARGATVVLTKQSQEQFVTNRERAEIANRCGADLMVRLHCDSASGSGISTYYPDRQGVKDGFRGPSAEVIAESAAIAPRFHHALVHALRGVLPDRGFHSDILTAIGSKQGALTGSIFSHVPVVLVEMCVLTNKHDEDFMVSPQGQERIAGALYEGIRVALLVVS